MRQFWILCLAIAAIVGWTGVGARADERCGDVSSPMVTSEGFGLGTCASRVPDYHRDDWAGHAPRGYARHASADDPMVWSDDQWRTDLMNGTDLRDDRYDRRFHRDSRPVVRIRRIEVHRAFSRPIEMTVRRSEDRPLDLRQRRSRMSVKRAGHHCATGVLVLTWTGTGEKARCLSSGRRRQPVVGRDTFPGRG